MSVNFDETSFESPIISLPADPDRIRQLRLKLEEYRTRLKLKRKNSPYKPPEFFIDNFYKIKVLEELLRSGKVVTHEFSGKLEKELGNLDVRSFDTVCAVIRDYAETGGKNLINGGLPE